jgi:hypothetical protein
MKTQFVADLFDVVLSRSLADEELARDFAIGRAERDELGDLLFPAGQWPYRRSQGGPPNPRPILSPAAAHVDWEECLLVWWINGDQPLAG